MLHKRSGVKLNVQRSKVKDLPNTELEMTCNTLKALITEKFSDKKVENNLKK
jgi:hypothetical protein